MQRVLIAGASGALGKQVTSKALKAGLCCRVLGRDRARLEALGAQELALANAVSGEGLTDALQGVDVVFSCLGASVAPEHSAGRQRYRDVDAPANINLIAAAERAGVKRMVYVSVAEHEQLGAFEYVKAHEQVVARLKQSSVLSFGVIRPVGFFSAFEAMLKLAQRGSIPLLGSPTARTNPIADAELADVCLETLLSNANIERSIGGPEVLTREAIAQLAFKALNKQAKTFRIPNFLVSLLLPLTDLVNPRLADITRFFLAASSRDCVAPSYGQLRLGQHFQNLAQGRSAVETA